MSKLNGNGHADPNDLLLELSGEDRVPDFGLPTETFTRSQSARPPKARRPVTESELMEANREPTPEGVTFRVGKSERFTSKRAVAAFQHGKELVRDTLDTNSHAELVKFLGTVCMKLGQSSTFTDTKGWKQAILAAADKHDFGDDDQTGTEPITYDIRSARQLDDSDCHIAYDIDDVLPTGTPQVIAGGSKSMKTWVAAMMAFSLAMGVEFLGRFQVREPRNVLFFSAESGMAVLQRNLRMIAVWLGFQLSDCTRLFISPNTVSFGDRRHIEALEQVCRERAIEVLFIDPLYLSMPGNDAGNLFIMGSYLRCVSEMCERNGITLVVVHHLRKNRGGNDQFAQPSLADIGWSGTAEWARSWVLLGRREAYKHDGLHRLWFEAGGSAGHSVSLALNIDEGTKDNRRLLVDLCSTSEVRQDLEERKAAAKRDEARDSVEARKKAIVDALHTLPEGEGEVQKTINSLAGINGDLATRNAYKALASEKVIEPCMVKRQKQSYPGFRLKQNTQPEAGE